MSTPLRALVLEDSRTDYKLLMRELERGGYEMTSSARVETAEELTAALADATWDVILADFFMPRFDALEGLKIVQEKGLDIPFIVVSGAIGEDIAVDAMKAGAHDYLMKSNLQRLVPAVERELREAESRRQHRRAEEELAQREAELSAIFEHAPVLMMLVDPERRVLKINRFAAEITGEPVEHMVGKRGGEALRCVHAFDSPAGCGFGPECERCVVRNTVLDTLKTGEPHDQVKATLTVHTKQGARTKYLLVSTSLPEVAGKKYVLVCIEDITERKRLERQIFLSQKMEAIGRLAGGVAHDFNNVLTVILGHTQLALMSAPKDSPIYQGLCEIQTAGARATELVRQLLAFGRKQALNPKVIDLRHTLQHMDTMLRRLIREDIELHTNPAGEPCLARADPGQVEQVIVNLVVNARDAMPAGGKIVLEIANVELDEDYARDHAGVEPGRYVMLGVSDTGQGIKEELQPHVFEPFFTTKTEGTGLGLSTVYGIVKQHGGHIWVYSEEGKGATFKVYLPAATGTGQEDRPSEDSKMPRGAETILVAEDEANVRNTAVKILSDLGYHVNDAPDGPRTLELMDKLDRPPALLLTDVVMPGMSGKKLAEECLRRFPDVKVLFMCGYTEESIKHNGLLKPGVELLQKPFTAVSLAQRVRQLLDTSAPKPSHQKKTGGPAHSLRLKEKLNR